MIRTTLAALAAATFLVSPASAAVIDFNAETPGTYTELTIAGVKFTFDGGDDFDVSSATPPVPPFSGNSLLSFFVSPGEGRYKAELNQGGVKSVSIDVGDYVPSDSDDVWLEAYDAGDNLLDFANILIDGNTSIVTLTVSSLSDIAYVKFYELGDFAGAVYWDNFTFGGGDVPEPAMLGLLGLGLAGLGLARRRKVA